MIDIVTGRYWDLPWSLVESCTRCSPGCDHCWALAIEKRFKKGYEDQVFEHPERLSIPLKRRKPTVYAVWNDFHHPAVTDDFKVLAYKSMVLSKQHTFLLLTKRPQVMADFLSPATCFASPAFPHIWNGLTACNQQEADEKIPVFLQVPGKKFLSIEPMLERMDISNYLWLSGPSTAGPWTDYTGKVVRRGGGFGGAMMSSIPSGYIDAVILGGETGPGARPLHPDWVRSVRDQCAAAGVPFFFKGWGAYGLNWLTDPQNDFKIIPGSEWMDKGVKPSGRLLDGRTHDELPWVK